MSEHSQDNVPGNHDNVEDSGNRDNSVQEDTPTGIHGDPPTPLILNTIPEESTDDAPPLPSSAPPINGRPSSIIVQEHMLHDDTVQTTPP